MPGVISTEAGRANGSAQPTENETTQSDGDQNSLPVVTQSVQIRFDPSITSVTVMEHLFGDHRPIQRKQTKGVDVGENTAPGVYSTNALHLSKAANHIASREDADRIALEILPLTHYVAVVKDLASPKPISADHHLHAISLGICCISTSPRLEPRN
ncbi:peptide-methionine (S)-S-oxide reductase [Vibrio lentus]|nr:peptide-methionine (S)-S-oxide reductase [Vibrio lentus]